MSESKSTATEHHCPSYRVLLLVWVDDEKTESEDVLREALLEKEIFLPFVPFAGLEIYATENDPVDLIIEDVGWTLGDKRFECSCRHISVTTEAFLRILRDLGNGWRDCAPVVLGTTPQVVSGPPAKRNRRTRQR